MTAAPPVSLAAEMRKSTRELHTAAENTPFILTFFRGEFDDRLYLRLLSDLYHVYTTMESAWSALCAPEADVPGGERARESLHMLHFPAQLHRAAALKRDMAFFAAKCGMRVMNMPADVGWRLPEGLSADNGAEVFDLDQPPMSAAAAQYVRTLHDIARANPIELVGHAYTRYLGDLSGGQMIRRVVLRKLVNDGVQPPAYESADARNDSTAAAHGGTSAAPVVPVAPPQAHASVASAAAAATAVAPAPLASTRPPSSSSPSLISSSTSTSELSSSSLLSSSSSSHTVLTGTCFYEFPSIDDVIAFKNEYRRRLDALPAAADACMAADVVRSALRAFELNIAVLDAVTPDDVRSGAVRVTQYKRHTTAAAAAKQAMHAPAVAERASSFATSFSAALAGLAAVLLVAALLLKWAGH